MAGRSRVAINRAALDEIEGGLVDGVFDIARAIVRVAETRAPDAPPYGQGLVDRGGAAVWVRGRKTHESATASGQRVDKPRSLTLKRAGHDIVAVAGFGFPAMFQELGTIRQRARPFFTPSVAEVLGTEAPFLLSEAMKRRLRGERAKGSEVIAQRIAAARERRAAKVAAGAAT